MDGWKGTLDSLATDGFDGDVVVGGSVVALEDLAVLTGADLATEDVVVDQLRHKYKTKSGYLSLG
jgi:hypothetical protein